MKSLFTLALFMCTQNLHAAKPAVLEQTIEYMKGAEAFEGFLALPKKMTPQTAAILVVHDWLGLTEKTKAKARELAALGYIAFAADIYGKGIRPELSAAPAQAGKFKGDRKLFRDHLNLALDELKKQKGVDANRIAAIGFCFGGTGVIELARSGAKIKGAVSFHGGLDSPSPSDGKNIQAKILALHGADDPFVPASDLSAFEQEMRTHKIDWQLIKYGGAVHSFTDKTAGNDNAKGAAYNASADQRSWAEMQKFFSEIFSTGTR